MPNMNGKVVLHTLMNLKQPATMKEIVALIAESAEVDPDEVKPMIIEILDNGVRYGFIQRLRGRYFVEDLGVVESTAINQSCSSMTQSSVRKSTTRSQSRPAKRGQSSSRSQSKRR